MAIVEKLYDDRAERYMAAAPGEVVGEDTGAPVDGEKGEPVEEAEEARDEALYEDEPPREEIEWTPNTKLRRISEVDVAAQPLSYRANTKKEELALAHVANFERQYIDLYPSRKPLLLCPINECGIPVRARARCAAQSQPANLCGKLPLHATPSPRAPCVRPALRSKRAEIRMHHPAAVTAPVQAAL